MSTTKQNPLVFNDNAVKNEILANLSLPIIALGLPSNIFNMETINKAYYTFQNIHKLYKLVSHLAEMGILENALRVGVTKGLIKSLHQCTVTEFVTWAKWLKTTEGQQIIHQSQLTKSLKKCVAQGETLEQVAMFRAFCIMRQEHGVAVKQANKDKDEELKKLRDGGDQREALKNTERKWDAEISKIHYDFGPVSAYHQPEKDEVDAAAYELYVAEARAEGREVLARNLFGLGIIDVDMYGRKVYEAAEKRHANNPTYRKEIEGYLARKIVEFQAKFDKKGQKKVCHLLGIISGKEVVDDVIAAAKKAGEKRTRPY